MKENGKSSISKFGIGQNQADRSRKSSESIIQNKMKSILPHRVKVDRSSWEEQSINQIDKERKKKR
jgi:hypothetical protein